MDTDIRCPIRMRQTIVPLRIEYRVQKRHLSWKGLENLKLTLQTVGIQKQKPYFIDLCLMYLRPVCMAYLLTLTGSACNKNFTQNLYWWTHMVDEFGKSLLNLPYLCDHICNIIIIISAIVTYYLTYMMFINSQLFPVIIIIFSIPSWLLVKCQISHYNNNLYWDTDTFFTQIWFSKRISWIIFLSNLSLVGQGTY